jgi:hypothetical protein
MFTVTLSKSTLIVVIHRYENSLPLLFSAFVNSATPNTFKNNLLCALGGARCRWMLPQGRPENSRKILCYAQTFITSLDAEPRPDVSPRVDTQSRADQKFAPRNQMLNADHHFSGFAMRTKED